ncbi:MAG: DNA/RNA nuclease SfsA [Clostridia bacterium]|nr:DNA/RNA nuclease SfsA [Clostridia bacterium]
MTYKNVVKGRFLSRPNRFIAYAEIDGREEKCHVKNTGRCKELLTFGAEIYLEKAPEGHTRKTGYDVIAVKKGEMLVNIDSNAPNAAAFEYLRALYGKDALIRPETTFGSSRFDFYVEKGEARRFIEIKGVTLEEGGIVRFPDAPTLRGAKHLRELTLAVREGYSASVLFIIQMAGMKGFLPNDQTDPDFGRELRAARAAGVEIRALECAVTPEKMTITKPIPLLF